MKKVTLLQVVLTLVLMVVLWALWPRWKSVSSKQVAVEATPAMATPAETPTAPVETPVAETNNTTAEIKLKLSLDLGKLATVPTNNVGRR